MLRITGGSLRGRKIEAPKNQPVRPTTALVRESLFNRLQNRINECRFLDLFAGSGLMGVEAISRGATFVLSIEKNRIVYQIMRRNYEGLGIGEEKATLACQDSWEVMSRPCKREPFDVIFLDPPYGYKGLHSLIKMLVFNGWLASGGVLVVEHGDRDPVLSGFDRYVLGDTVLSIAYAEDLESFQTTEHLPSTD